MKHLLRRVTLECHRQPGDAEKAPWYAYPLAMAFIVGVYAFIQTADAVGF